MGKSFVASVFAGVVCWAVAGADGIWNWDGAAEPDGRSVTAWAAWSDNGNWQGGTPPAGEASVAYLAPPSQSSSLAAEGARYISVPDGGVDVGELNIRQFATVYLRGGPIRLGTSSSLSPNAPRIRDEGTSASLYIYAPVDMSRKAALVNKVNFCGPVVPPESGELVSSHYVNFYGHLWAADTSANVVDPAPNMKISIGSGSHRYYARMSAAAVDGVWRTVEGSPILTRAGPAHDIAPGTAVTGPGVPEGAFVRAAYSMDAIELSAPCSAHSGDAGVTLSFAAFPDVRTVQHFKSLRNQSSDLSLEHTVSFTKFRPEDGYDVHIDEIPGDSGDMAIDCAACPADLRASGSDIYGARVFLRKCSLPASRCFRNARMTLVADPSDGDALAISGMAFGPRSVPDASMQAVMEAPEGKAFAVADIRAWNATLVKRGAGLLDMAATNLVAFLPLAVEAGTVAIRALRAEGDQTLQALALAAGTTFRLDAGALRIASLTAAPGAAIEVADGAALDLSGLVLPPGVIIRGPGAYVLEDAVAASRAAFEGRPVVRFRSQGTEADVWEPQDIEAGVPGDPAFWVQGTRNLSTRTYSATEIFDDIKNEADKRPQTFVDCWRDCREDATGAWRCPYYATNDWSGLVGVDVGVPGRLTAQDGFACVHHDGIARTTVHEGNGRFVQSGMVWNRPITNICSVFHVLYDGASYGQALLGHTTRFAVSRNGDFKRGISKETGGGGIGSPHAAFVFDRGAADQVKGGDIYVNGVLRRWDECANVGGIAVYEVHVAAPYAAADAFAIQEPHGVTCSGCMKQYECIIYTNVLSATERMQVRQYLMNKYRGESVNAAVGANRFKGKANLGVLGALDVSLDVDAGKALGIVKAAEGQTVSKSGAGRLYVDTVEGADLVVKGGELVVRSCSLSDDVIPDGAFVHLDATATNRMVLTAKPYPDSATRTEVTVWRDKYGRSAVSAQRRTTDGRYCAPCLAHPEALGGRPVVDYGIVTNTASADVHYGWGWFHDFSSSATTGSAPMNYTNTTTIGSVFMMIGSGNGGGVPLGGYACSPWRDGDCAALRDPATPLFGLTVPAALRTSGENYLNGEAVRFSETGLSGGYDIVSARSADVNGAAAQIQSLMMAKARALVGGGALGEVLIFEKPVGSYTHQRIDAWLNWKWFGRRIASLAPSAARRVSVAAGATLTVSGGAPLSVASFACQGTVDGSVVFTAGAELLARINDDGSITPATVAGGADLSSGGTVRLVGDVGRLDRGPHLLVAASDVALGKWSVAFAGTVNRAFALRRTAEGVCLLVADKGTALIFR